MENTINRILIIQYSSNRDGSAFSGLLLAEGLLKAGYEVHVAFGFDGPLIEEYRLAGCHTHIFRHKNWLRRKDTLHFFKDVISEYGKLDQINRLITKVRPALVYVNTAVSLAGVLGAKKSATPCIWHLREMLDDVGGELQAPGWARPFIHLAIHNLGDKVIANSRATAKNLIGERRLHDTEIIPNAVGTRYFHNTISDEEARAKFNLPRQSTIIGVPGTLRPIKGHLFFFRGIAPLLKKRSDLVVVVSGSGENDYVQHIHKVVTDLGIFSQVFFIGWIDDMPAFYRACNLVCVPSKAEPFGRTVIEAMASKVPIVASAVGGIAEIIDNGNTGLLFTYGDQRGLKEGISRLLDSPALCDELTHTAFQVAHQKYHERVYQKRLTGITERMIRETGARHDIAAR